MGQNKKELCFNLMIVLFIFSIIFITLHALISIFAPPPYFYNENIALITMWITIVLILFSLVLGIKFRGWKSLYKDFFSYLAISAIIFYFISASHYYLAWMSISLSPSTLTTVKLIDKEKGYKKSCKKWTVQYLYSSKKVTFCQKNNKIFVTKNIGENINVKLTQTWIADEIQYVE